jgi:peptidoglycan hydrolase-like amidase
MPLALLTLRIAVFVLFHPTQLEVRPAVGNVLAIESEGQTRVLEPGSSARFDLSAPALTRVTGRAGRETDFVLSVPGKIERRFHGVLEVRRKQDELQSVVTMDREIAVASAVAAESPPGEALEGQKAQAVVSRSFYAAARGRHTGFDYCDTTHCQFLRQPPGAGELAFEAAAATRNLVLAYRGAVFPALYSANCGGHTDALGQTGGYTYFAVECPMRGEREGHGIGLCQRGAAKMAAQGANFRTILEHYYPRTTMVQMK